MPCGKETVVHYEDPVQAAKDIIHRMYKLKSPRDLWEEFEEFPPLFINQSVGEEGILQHMKEYLAKSSRTAMPDQKKLLGVLKAQKVLLYTPRAQNHCTSKHDRLLSSKTLRLVRARGS